MGLSSCLFAGDPILEELDGMIANVLDRYRVQDKRVAIGGFSARGIGAVRYA